MELIVMQNFESFNSGIWTKVPIRRETNEIHLFRIDSRFVAIKIRK